MYILSSVQRACVCMTAGEDSSDADNVSDDDSARSNDVVFLEYPPAINATESISVALMLCDR